MRRVLSALLIVLVLGPGVLRAQDAATTLTIGLREDPDVLDPTLGSAYVSRIVYAAMCDKLFDLDAHLGIVPQLATGYDYADPTHLLIHLRPGVLFQDGEKLDAEAVKVSLTRHLTAKGSMRVGEINAIAAIEVVDPSTVRLVLKAPSAPLLAQLTDRSGIVMSPRALAEEGAEFSRHPVCAGPYAFAERVVQDHIALRRFPQYWNAQDVHFDRVIYRPIVNPTVRLTNLQAGALDLVEYIAPNDVAAVRRDPHLKLAIGDGLAYTGINFNVANGPGAGTPAGRSALVRQAFEAAIDRKALNEVVFGGLFAPTAQPNPPGSPYFEPSVPPPPRDLARARALLAQAHVALPVQVTLNLPNSPDTQQLAEVLQSMVGEAGFDLKLHVLEFASALQAGYRGEFAAFLIGWSGRSDPDGNWWQLLHTGGTFNYGHWSDPEFDAALDSARAVASVDQRRGFYAQALRRERADLPLIYLYTSKNIVGMAASLSGFRQVPDGLIRLGGLVRN